MRDIQDAIEQFYGSPEWAKAKEEDAIETRYGVRFAIRDFLKRMHGLTEEDDTPLDILKETGLVETAIRSKWRDKSRKTWERKKKLKQKELVRRAKRAIERFVKLKSPLLFGSELDVQHRPINPNKPRRKVA